MGLCASSVEEIPMVAKKRDPMELKRNEEVDLELKQDRIKDKKVKKLLLLGPGESGKSTLFKQARALYGKEFTQYELMDFANTVTENIISSMQILIQQCEENDRPLRGGSQTAAEMIKNVQYKDLAFIDPDLGRAIELLWADPNIQEMFARRSEFQLFDCIRYFAQEIRRIAVPNYVPTFQDCLMARRLTLGVYEISCFPKGNHLELKFVDVGGQRSQRSKWMNQFSVCDAIVYVAAINEYDQTLFEDHNINRIQEALDLFGVLCDNKALEHMNLILFLNKRDLFEEKLLKMRVPLNQCFPDYAGGADFNAATKFISQKFVEKNKNMYREIFTHVSCATDTNQAQVVLDVLTKQMIDKLLEKEGLV
jgi:GTPase SAR1 family protein